jgi:hypothetical protein
VVKRSFTTLVPMMAGLCLVATTAGLVGPMGVGVRAAEPSSGPAASPVLTVSPVPGASPSFGPAPSLAAIEQLCDLWPVADVSAALGGEPMTVDETLASPQSCGYKGGKGSFTAFAVALYFGDETTGSLPDLIRQNFADAVDVVVGGAPALRTPQISLVGEGKGWKQSALYVFPDPLTMLQVQTAAPKGVDGEAATVALVEAALPGLAAVPRPSPAPSVAPTASAAAVGLNALFPTTIGGSPVDVEPPGINLDTADPKAMKRLTKELRKQDLTPDDLVFAAGFPQSGSATIIAIQAPGAKIGPLVDDLLNLLAMGDSGKKKTIAGKKARIVQDQGYVEYHAYPKDDVLWLVHADGSDLAEIFENLP